MQTHLLTQGFTLGVKGLNFASFHGLAMEPCRKKTLVSHDTWQKCWSILLIDQQTWVISLPKKPMATKWEIIFIFCLQAEGLY